MSRDETVKWFYNQLVLMYGPLQAWVIAESAADWLEGKEVREQFAQLAHSIAVCRVNFATSH